jgi:D-serine deaminase-like pyridoxal phosphate-dependent protein
MSLNAATNLESIDTPALLVDATRYERNIAACFAQFTDPRVTVRPHLKTAKSPVIAHHLLAAGARGFCVAKLGEAEVMAAHGLEDLLVTTQIVGAVKVARLIELVRRHPEVKTVVDSLAGARAIDRAAGESGVRVKILLDVNVGQNRCGIEPEAAAEFARTLERYPNLELVGVQGYEGHQQHVRDPLERRRLTGIAMERLAFAVSSIRDLGVPVPIVTTGGTGTGAFCAEHGVVTEVQPGSFIFMDSDYLATGGLPYASALSVLTTVISAPSSDRVIVDAGNKALSMDSGFAQPRDLAGWSYAPAGDEHGTLTREPGVGSNLAVGDRVELIPSHIDTTVNLHDEYVVIRDGVLEDRWPILARGKIR